MTENLSNPNEAWRNFTRRIAIEACKLQMDDLKRLYRILNEKQFDNPKYGLINQAYQQSILSIWEDTCMILILTINLR